MSSIATAIHMDGVTRKILGTDAVRQIASEVNDVLISSRQYFVDEESVTAALGEYLTENIDERLTELLEGDWSMDGWSYECSNPEIIWDMFCDRLGYREAVSELYDFASQFSEVCTFTSVGGYLSYEIIGFPDYPINGCHLNADRPAMAIA
jgi:hypothetical protein